MTTLREALHAARACIQQDRTAFADCSVGYDGTFEPDDARALAEYDAVLAQIDAALGTQAGPQSPQDRYASERSAFVAWLGIEPCGQAHEFAWQAWRARAELNASEPLCPRPGNTRPDNLTMAECILAGECGCTVAGHKYAQRTKPEYKPLMPSELDDIWEQAERRRHPMTSVAYQMAYAVEQEVLRRLGVNE